MKLVIFSALLLFAGLAHSQQRSRGEGFIDDGFFSSRQYCTNICTSENDIVNVYALDDEKNFNINDDLIFIEKDLASGEDKGLFVRKAYEITKLLPNGRDVAGVRKYRPIRHNVISSKLYFAASDGIYIYNSKENKADKYGTITDDLISITVDTTGDIIYVLTKNKQLFKVTDNGEKKVKVSEVSNAEQIVMDFKDRLFYSTPEKEVYVFDEGTVKKVEGLPTNPNKVTLLKFPFGSDGDMTVVVDDKAFIIFNHDWIREKDIQFEVKPTACSMQQTYTHYFGYNKKIYACRRGEICKFRDTFSCVTEYTTRFM